MSYNSAKQNYEQCKEWLETVKRPNKSTSTPVSFQNESRLEYYARKNNR